eukprot:c1696_g1_i1.p3 GENE.c1696_g1_i1~~c1696_g1_i1.p3  ORF type:complete len:123 (+),score=26.33 c1696_g1_i1:2-370(+)
MFLLANCMHQSGTMKGAPRARVSDGACDLLFIREAGRRELLSLFMKMDAGKHAASPLLTYVKTRAMRLEPVADPAATMGIDGERVSYAAVNVEVHPGLCLLAMEAATLASLNDETDAMLARL